MIDCILFAIMSVRDEIQVDSYAGETYSTYHVLSRAAGDLHEDRV